MSAERYERAARELGKGFLSDAYARGGLAPDGGAPGIDATDADPSAQDQETGIRPGAEFKTPFGEDARRELHQRAGNDGFIQSNLVASRVTSQSERTHREREKRGGSKDEMLRIYLMTMRGNLQELAGRIAQDLDYWNKELVRIDGELEELGHDFASVTKAREHFEKTGSIELGPDGKPLDPRLNKFIEMWEQKHGKKFDPENSSDVREMFREADGYCQAEEIRLKGEQSHAQAQRDKLEEDAVKVDDAIKMLDEAKTPEEQRAALREIAGDPMLKGMMAEHGVEDEISGLDFEDLGFDEMPDEDIYFGNAPDMKGAFDKASFGEAAANIDMPKNDPNRLNPTIVKFDF